MFHTAGRVSAADMSVLSSVGFHLNNDADVCYPRAASSDRHFAFVALRETSSTQTGKVMQFFVFFHLFICVFGFVYMDEAAMSSHRLKVKATKALTV